MDFFYEEQGLLKFHHLTLFGADLGDAPPDSGFDRIEEFHDFDNANRIIFAHRGPHLHVGRSPGFGGPVEGPQHRSFDGDESWDGP